MNGVNWVRTEQLKYVAFGQSQASSSNLRNVYSIPLQGLHSQECVEAIEIPVICAPLYKRAVPDAFMRSLNLQERKFCCVQEVNAKVDILVGMDAYWRLVRGETQHMCENLVAQNTVFGWILPGTYPNDEFNADCVATHLFSLSVSDDCLKLMWQLDAIGIDADYGTAPEDRVLTEFKSSIRYEDGRYCVALPWKTNHPQLMNNKGIADYIHL